MRRKRRRESRTLWVAVSSDAKVCPLTMVEGKTYSFTAAGIGAVEVRLVKAEGQGRPS